MSVIDSFDGGGYYVGIPSRVTPRKAKASFVTFTFCRKLKIHVKKKR